MNKVKGKKKMERKWAIQNKNRKDIWLILPVLYADVKD